MKSTLNLFFTLLLLLLLAPAVASAQTKTCPKCKRAIQVSQYAAHQGNCKGAPKPTTQRCPQCGQQIAVAQYSSHVANHQKQAEAQRRQEQARRAEQQRQEEARRAEQQRQEEARRAEQQKQEEARKKQEEENRRKAFAAKVMADMVYVEGGTFMMGALPNDKKALDSEKPRHQVTLSSFYISKYEVTQELWQAVMGSNPSLFKGDLQRPVECVSWNDCQTFIRKLNELTGEQFRLPTEAEWEYAARGGQKSRGYLYSGSNDIADVAWYDDNSGDGTHPVGRKQPNELGLYDMSGNVYEWCQDWYGPYSSSAQTNPTGPASASDRVYRGGSWFNFYARYCRASYRKRSSPVIRYYFLGLRLAR